MTRPENTGSEKTGPENFDQAMRRRHADAIAHLSLRTQTQLRNRLAAAVAAPRHATHRGAWTAATCAGLVALAFVVQWRPQPESVPRDALAATATATSGDTPLATLDENPDLYLWLASKDAIALASE